MDFDWRDAMTVAGSARATPALRALRWLFALLVFWALDGVAVVDDERDIVVDVRQVGDVVIIDAKFHAPVAQVRAWGVLTDFENMARIVSNLETSTVLSRGDSRLVVAQTGYEREGILSFAFETVRQVDLRPFSEIRSQLLRGSLRRLDGTTYLITRDGGTDIVSHGECVPGTWVPPVVGLLFTQRAARKQFAELRREMIRREG
jgi:hypothetical protein